ncbi:glutamyl-tRNA amidotransferase subunit B [Phlyctochytrium arcticum]|nr:glutamyl-tRNA amidotransferase subunit B [Phlyctochytrium arcticum]
MLRIFRTYPPPKTVGWPPRTLGTTHKKRRLYASAPCVKAPSGRQYEAVIGLEIHAQLLSSGKLFSPAPSPTALKDAATASPNTCIAPFDAAFPGALPVINPSCVALAIRAALALNSEPQATSYFDRKHYFYPDLPAGYQITQFFSPIAKGGQVAVTEQDGLAYTRDVQIQQIQLETDSGKSMKEGNRTLVDLNRAGVGVLEIVTRPDLRSASETVIFLKKLQRLLWYNGISSPDMDEGAWRCDVNISVREPNGPLGQLVEIKHLVKFTSIKSAIEYEISRQIGQLEQGKKVVSETRGFDVNLGCTTVLRSKEDTADYRYLPEPDLPALYVSPDAIRSIASELPESLDLRRSRLSNDHGLSRKQIELLMDEPGGVEYFTDTMNGVKIPGKSQHEHEKGPLVAKWVTGDLVGFLKMRGIKLRACPVPPTELAEILNLIRGSEISALRGKDILHLLIDGDKRTARGIATDEGWLQNSDKAALEEMCRNLILKHPSEADQVRAGRSRVLKFFVGQIMQQTKGRSNPVLLAEIFKTLLPVSDKSQGTK